MFHFFRVFQISFIIFSGFGRFFRFFFFKSANPEQSRSKIFLISPRRPGKFAGTAVFFDFSPLFFKMPEKLTLLAH